MIKNVAVFGATTRTGMCVVNAAIEKGFNVRVLLDCQEEWPKGWSESLEVVAGDVLDIQHVKTTLEGQDAAVVLLGSNDNQGATCEGLKNIVAVMELLYIKLISICFPTHTMSQSIQRSRDVLAQDQSRMSKVVESSNLHWVSVVAPCVTDDVATGYTIVRKHTAGAARLTAVSRPDLAAFLVDCLSMPERYQKTVEIASFAKR